MQLSKSEILTNKIESINKRNKYINEKFPQFLDYLLQFEKDRKKIILNDGSFSKPAREYYNKLFNDKPKNLRVWKEAYISTIYLFFDINYIESKYNDGGTGVKYNKTSFSFYDRNENKVIDIFTGVYDKYNFLVVSDHLHSIRLLEDRISGFKAKISLIKSKLPN